MRVRLARYRGALRILSRVGLVLLLLGGGCATADRPKLTIPVNYTGKAQGGDDLWPSRDLKSVFEQYWAARLAGDWEAAFRMEAPHVQEMVAAPLYENYVKNAPRNQWLGMEILDLERHPDYFVAVAMRLTYKGRRAGREEIFLKDLWVEVEGRWYHVLRDQLLFPALSEAQQG